MKIIFFVNVDWFFISHRLAIAQELLRTGHEVHLATTITTRTNRERLMRAGLVLHEITIDRSAKQPLLLLTSFFNFFILLLTAKPDLVHLVTLQPNLLGGLCTLITRTPTVFAISGLGHAFSNSRFLLPSRRSIITFLYSLVFLNPRKKVVFQNESDRSLLVSTCFLPFTDTALIPGSGVDPSLFPHRHFHLPDVPVVSMAARLLWSKGVSEFAQLASNFSRLSIPVRFLLAGAPDPSNPESLTASDINDLAALGCLELCGHVDDIPSLLQKTTIFILPSYYPEGLPKVICEASMAGCPVITTDMPGCRDSVINGVTGLIVPPRCHESLTRSLQYLLQNPIKLQEISTSARLHALDNFSLEAIVSQHLIIYNEIAFTPTTL